jgi:methyl-accepting chemotaxis protein
LISESTSQVQNGVDLVARTGEALERIVTKVAQIDGLVAEFSSSAEQQASGLRELNTAVGELDKVTQQNAAMVEEATAASYSLKTKTVELAEKISTFRVTNPPQSLVATLRSAREPEMKSNRSQTPVHAVPQRARKVAVVGGAAQHDRNDDEGWTTF